MRILTMLLGTLSSQPASAQFGSAVAAAGGYTLAQISSVKKVSFSSLSGILIGFSHYPTARLGLIFEHELVRNADLGRIGFQASRFGAQFFPFSATATIGDQPSAAVTYTASAPMRPYFGGGLSMGRILVDTFGDVNALEIGSEFVGVFGIAGATYTVAPQVSVDARLGLEPCLGIGVVSLSALVVHARLGLQLALP